MQNSGFFSLRRLGGLFFTFALLLSAVGQAHAEESTTPRPERRLFAARNSFEARLKFQFEVRYRGANSHRAALEAVDDQVQYLFGPMGVRSPLAVPKNKYSTRIIDLKAYGSSQSTWVARYEYDGIIQVENTVGNTLEVLLPYNPSTIYRASRGANGRYPCTDPHYQSEGDFWYFWNPENRNCPLREGTHYAKVEGQITPIANTELTYPEYGRLVRESNGVQTIRFDMLYGMDDVSKGKDPRTSADLSADSYRSLTSLLEDKGFQAGERWRRAELDAVIVDPNEDYGDPFVIEYTKQVRGIRFVVRIFFGASGAAEDSLPFHYFLKDAIENASVLIYSGHSGLGASLDLDWIESTRGFTIDFDKRNYQIFFMNGCSTYTYYNRMFFDRKKSSRDSQGTKNLDVLTNGLATYFDVMDTSDFYLINAVYGWARGNRPVSYQRLADMTDSDNLYGVNGDEDNPTDEDDPAVRPHR